MRDPIFILVVVEDTWVHKLRESITLYTAVLPSELLSHLQVLCGGLHALDVIALQNEINHYLQDMEGTPKYINTLKDAQKRSKRAGNSVTEDTLLLIAKNAMLSMERFCASLSVLMYLGMASIS